MTKTVTLALEWRIDFEGDDELFVGPVSFGWLESCDRYRIIPNFDTPMERYYPTREAAMAALEEAVMAMGATAKQQER